MKTFATIVVSAALGFVTVFQCVPRREPERIPPTWFELPGLPVSVDGQPTRTWDEVNQALRRATSDHMHSVEFVENLKAKTPETSGPRVRITYVPAGRSAGPGRTTVEEVTVRPFFPVAVPWSRAHQTDLVRYEVERPDIAQ